MKRIPARVAAGATLCGGALGVAYSLSPMFVCVCLGLPLLFARARRGLTPRERRWVTGFLGVALVARLLVIAAVVLVTNHDGRPFAALFGDEIHVKLTSLWLRNVALNVPVGDYYTFALYDPYGRSGFIYAAGLVQLFVGPSPYGLHLLNVVLHLAGCIVMHRVLRQAYGAGAAMCALIALLFWPTLFVWSVSALKETSFFALNALLIGVVMQALRAAAWRRRILCGLAAASLTAAIGTLRSGVLVIVVAGLAGALVGHAGGRRPRLTAVAAVLLLAGAGFMLRSPVVQDALMARIRHAARYHWGSVYTPGYTYKLLDARFYHPRGEADIPGMTKEETARFVIRAAVSFWVVPAPWQATSRTLAHLAYIPQTILWYVTMVLALVGFVCGLRRSAPLTWMLAAYTIGGAAILSLYNGNIGTLIRTRDMVVPMVLCLSGVGAATVLRNWADRYVRAGGSDTSPLCGVALPAAAGAGGPSA